MKCSDILRYLISYISKLLYLQRFSDECNIFRIKGWCRFIDRYARWSYYNYLLYHRNREVSICFWLFASDDLMEYLLGGIAYRVVETRS